MEKVLSVLSNRRVWAAIVGGLSFLLTALKVDFNVDNEALAEALATLGTAIGMLITAGLALWSFLKPKTPKS